MNKRILAAMVFSLVPTRAAAATVSGPASVFDGDSLEVVGRRVRLFGIDAPEVTQTCERDGGRWDCGKASAERLRALIGGEPVTYTGSEVDQYGRLLAVCTVAGVDLDQTMVADGWAAAFHRYSEDYAFDETRVRR